MAVVTLGRQELEKNSEIVLSKFNTFCSLCSKEIKKDTVALQSQDDEENVYLIHTMCEVETGTHKTYFQKEIKKSGRKRKNPQKKKRIADKDYGCTFCSKPIKKDNEWVGNGQGKRSKKYHPDCWTRYKRVVNRTRESLRR